VNESQIILSPLPIEGLELDPITVEGLSIEGGVSRVMSIPLYRFQEGLRVPWVDRAGETYVREADITECTWTRNSLSIATTATTVATLGGLYDFHDIHIFGGGECEIHFSRDGTNYNWETVLGHNQGAVADTHHSNGRVWARCSKIRIENNHASNACTARIHSFQLPDR